MEYPYIDRIPLRHGLARAFRHRHGLLKSAAAHAWQEPSATPAKANLGIPITL